MGGGRVIELGCITKRWTRNEETLTQVLDDEVSLLVVDHLGVLVRDAFPPADGVAPHEDIFAAGWVPNDGDAVVLSLGPQCRRRVWHHSLVEIRLKCRCIQPASRGTRSIHCESRDLHLILLALVQARDGIEAPRAIRGDSLAASPSFPRLAPAQLVPGQDPILGLLGGRLPAHWGNTTVSTISFEGLAVQGYRKLFLCRSSQNNADFLLKCTHTQAVHMAGVFKLTND